MALRLGGSSVWIASVGMLAVMAGNVGFALGDEPTAKVPTGMATHAHAEEGDLTPHHAELARLAGRWEATLSLWVAPDIPPLQAKTTVDRTLILDGRFLHTHLSVGLSGRVYEAILLEGFDPVSGTHTTTWIENGDLPLLTFVGECQTGGRTWSSQAHYTDVTTRTPRRLKAAAALTAPNRFTYHQSIVGLDDERPRLELVMFRQPPG